MGSRDGIVGPAVAASPMTGAARHRRALIETCTAARNQPLKLLVVALHRRANGEVLSDLSESCLN